MREVQVVEVHERWRLRNGSYAIISFRSGATAVGNIEGSTVVLTWEQGKAPQGRGYDLIEQAEPEPKTGV